MFILFYERSTNYIEDTNILEAVDVHIRYMADAQCSVQNYGK